ncbi:MAG: zinc-ribbon domain containing protein [Selenomonadaceae bacterium]|nr:zinc-ribbon domain containing protein [Selenomonadaceae bacterium]
MVKNPNEIQSEFLERCVRDCDRIFIDTCSFLEETMYDFFQNIVPILEREQKTVIVPLAVCQELERFANNPAECRKEHPDNPNLNKLAIHACETINVLKRANIVQIFADPDDKKFADNIFLYVFLKIRLKYNVLFITQDNGLAHDACDIFKDSRSVKGVKKILVCKIVKNGYLKNFSDDKPKKFPQPVKPSSENIPPNERFAFANEVVDIEGNLPVTKIPVEGEYVTAVRNGQTKQIRLIEEVGSGGEGSVYKTDFDGYVAKIYKPEKITRLRHEKLKLMLSKDINCEGVCFPLAMIHNQRNEFVGYLMRAASGKDLGKSVFMPMLLKKYFPKWNRVDTVQLCVTILKKIKYLHDRNVILGDINPYNILVVSPTEVYFVDTDSYQVEGFICPVGMPLFTAPELQKKKYGLRTLGNENFAVTTLLFMIMHPGKPPYAMQDGEGIVENIIKGEFSYPLGERKTGKVPQGPWRFCWSHLTYKIKEAFYETFWRDGMYHDEKNRPGTGFWLRLFEYYLKLLKNGTMTANDEESILIFPTRFKREKDKIYAKCKLCGKEFVEDSLEQGICRACLHDGEKYQCERCGGEIIYTNYQKYIKRAKRYKICRACFERTNTIFERRSCKDCGRTFEITYGQKEFFDAKGMSLPTRCEVCRKKPRPSPTVRHTPTTVTMPPRPTPSQPVEPPKKNGWCFITTAVCEYLGKPDDCFELTTLRNFRDNWLALQTGGKEEIREYYEIAPKIVEKLAASDEKDSLYEKIRLDYIEPCLEEILHGHNENCRARYREMVLMLKQKFSID